MQIHTPIQLPKSFPPIPSNPRFVDLTGQKFERLEVKGYSHTKYNSHWYVLCDCGTVKIVNSQCLLTGKTKSCGCYAKEATASRRLTHGLSVNRSPTPEFYSYYHAKARCTNPNEPNYPRYGGRGIEFRFNSVQEFFDEVGERPSSAHTIDRIDNDGHYEKGNIRWATKTEQARKRHTSRLLTLHSETVTVAEWAERIGIKSATLYMRRTRGWCDECTLTLPINGGTCSHISE